MKRPEREVGNRAGASPTTRDRGNATLPSQRPHGLTTPVARRRSLLRVVGWVGAIIVALGIFLASASPDAGGVLTGLPVGSDKVAHGLAYAVLAGLLTLGSRRPWLAVLLAVAYGFSDEFHQSFVPSRTADAYDLVADTVGAMVGAFAVGFLQRPKSPRRIE